MQQKEACNYFSKIPMNAREEEETFDKCEQTATGLIDWRGDEFIFQDFLLLSSFHFVSLRYAI